MPSPFPGMDPYLESPELWPAFHIRFVTELYWKPQPGFGDRYRARMSERVYPCQLGEQHETYIEIRDRESDRLVSLLDVVSPTNKTTVAGRAAYLQTRQLAKETNANVVEIDLILQGAPMLDYSREGLPDWDYAITVTRATHPERYEIYTATPEKRLPRFRLPLAGDDRDTVIDLGEVFNAVYEKGAFSPRINYRREPTTHMKEKWRDYVRQLLDLPSHAEIARAAHRIWEEEGCPHGRDGQHWHQAIERLSRER